MATTNYYSVGGELLGEETGGVRRDYLTDALGSVTATVTSAGAIKNTYRYKPYGALLSKTGSGTDPAFTWVGKWGYRQTNKAFSDVYIRARHYASNIGRWTTVDPIKYHNGFYIHNIGNLSKKNRKYIDIVVNQFVYVNGIPVSYIDYSGLFLVYPNDSRWPSPESYNTSANGVAHRRLCAESLDGKLAAMCSFAQVLDARLSALTLSKQRGGQYLPLNGGPTDAYRHCIWSCQTFRNCGLTAFYCFVIDHENSTAPWANGNWDPVYSPMDLCNDNLGFNFGKKKNVNCKEVCYNSVVEGNLGVLPDRFWF